MVGLLSDTAMVTPDPLLTVLAVIVIVLLAVWANNRRTLDKKGDATNALVSWTTVLAIANVLIALLSFGTLTAINGQLDEMRLERRPWVAVNFVVGGISWDQSGVSIPIRYELKNTGRGPAMHVFLQDALLMFVSAPDPDDDPDVWIKKESAEERKRPLSEGYPLLPLETVTIAHTLNFSNERIIAFTNLTKGKLNLITLSISYVVDYSFDIGQDHHQTSCVEYLYKIDEHRPLGPGLAVTIGENLSNTRLRAEALFPCDAD
jgi:hypothetical protein